MNEVSHGDGGMSVIEVRGLTKRFGSVVAVDELTFSVQSGEILVLLGASGCGKTTTLRCIAGLEEATGGEISIGGAVVESPTTHVPSERRGVGMVFQSYALWPHMNVHKNVGYGLTIAGKKRAEIDAAVRTALATVGLSGLEDRFPFQLSGGQQQRVALARGIITQPRVLLLDEPLSNLDAKLREQMRHELRVMIKRVGITAIYITHDQSEAMVIADRIIVMQNGRRMEEAAPRDLYRKPRTRFGAQFVGAATFLPARAVATEASGNSVMFRTASGMEVWAAGTAAAGTAVTLMIRPERVRIASVDHSTSRNRWVGLVKTSTFLGSANEFEVAVGPDVLRSHSLFDAEPGAEVTVHIPPEDVHWLAGD